MQASVALRALLVSFLFGCGSDSDPLTDAGTPDAAWETRTLFEDDFQAYADRSNLSGQGGWTGDKMLVGERATLSSSVAAGQIDPGSLERAVLQHELPAFGAEGVLTLSFRGYAYENLPLSDKSGIFLSAGSDGDVGWFASKGAGLVWRFDCRDLTGIVYDFEDVFGGYGKPVSLSVVIDFSAGDAYGVSDFGDGPRESAHVGLTREQAAALHSVVIVQDYQNPDQTLGADFDDIEVSHRGPVY